jgi:hypothetical protein
MKGPSVTRLYQKSFVDGSFFVMILKIPGFGRIRLAAAVVVVPIKLRLSIMFLAFINIILV